LVGIVTLLVAIWTALTTQQNYELSRRNLELVGQNQQLQNMLYNYTPMIFAYPTTPVIVDLRKFQPNGELELVVVIVTPHNGYAFVNQTFFRLYNDSYTKDFLDQSLLSYNSIMMYRELIFAVPQGSLQTTLRVRFLCDVVLAWEHLQPGRGGSFPLGEVGLSITFRDVQAKKTHSANTTVYIRVVF